LYAPIGVNLFGVYDGFKDGPQQMNDGDMRAGMSLLTLDKTMAGKG
jgi:hypothetical protein